MIKPYATALVPAFRINSANSAQIPIPEITSQRVGPVTPHRHLTLIQQAVRLVLGAAVAPQAAAQD